MKNIEEFKLFVKQKPSLVQYIRNNEMTWQKFYELWHLYGPEHYIWKNYSGSQEIKLDSYLKEIINMARKLDLESFQKSISGIQKGISLIQDLTNNKNDPETSSESYSPRPMFRRFED